MEIYYHLLSSLHIFILFFITPRSIVYNVIFTLNCPTSANIWLNNHFPQVTSQRMVESIFFYRSSWSWIISFICAVSTWFLWHRKAYTLPIIMVYNSPRLIIIFHAKLSCIKVASFAKSFISTWLRHSDRRLTIPM